MKSFLSSGFVDFFKPDKKIQQLIVGSSIAIFLVSGIFAFAFFSNGFISEFVFTVGAFVCFITLLLLTTGYLFLSVKNSYSINEQLVARLTSDKEIIYRNFLVSKEELARVQKEKDLSDHLLRVIAHDVKSPLKNLIGVMNLAVDGDLKQEKLVPILEDILTTARYTDQLLDNLLSWTESKTINQSVQNERIDLKGFTDSLIEEIFFISSLKHVAITNSIMENVYVFADRKSLKIVMSNLLLNGIKYSNSYQKIEITSTQSDGSICIEIADQGIGMSDELLKTLFLPTINKVRLGTNNEKGNGIGLLLCKKLIEDQHGRLSATSVVGQGSKFNIELPVEDFEE